MFLTISNLKLISCDSVNEVSGFSAEQKGLNTVCAVSCGLSVMFITTVEEKGQHYEDFSVCRCVHMLVQEADSVWSQLLC